MRKENKLIISTPNETVCLTEDRATFAFMFGDKQSYNLSLGAVQEAIAFYIGEKCDMKELVTSS